MGGYAALTDVQLEDLAAYINAARYGKKLTDGTGIARIEPEMIHEGKVVNGLNLPNVMLGSASKVRASFALRAPIDSALRIYRVALKTGAPFTLNGVNTAAADRLPLAALAAAPAAAVGMTVVTSNDQACPTTNFELPAGMVCGLEVTMDVGQIGKVVDTLTVYSDAQTSMKDFDVAAVITAQATGGVGAGGCTTRSVPGLFDPVLLMLSGLAALILGRRHRQKKSRV